jgi:transposase
MGRRRRFTPEFKRQAAQLLNAGQCPAAEIARELGIPRNRLYKWQKAVTERERQLNLVCATKSGGL